MYLQILGKSEPVGLSLNIIKSPIICDGTCDTGKKIRGSKRLCSHNSLLALFSNLCKEWNFQRNISSPSEYLPGSNVMVWWKCKDDPCGCHQWQAMIYHRTCNKSGCPFCVKGLHCPHNNITITNPDIIKEWDFERNIQSPSQYTKGSHEEVWWKCIDATCDCHKWKASIKHRCSGTGCPFCKNKRVCPHYNLSTIYPDIVLEWDYDMNEKGPETYSPASNDMVKWRCKNNSCGCHNWEASILNRTCNESQCPFCMSGKACPHYNLLQQYPNIALEWNYDLNENGPETYSPGSSANVWWKCHLNPCGCHQWQAAIGDRTRQDTGCPFCNVGRSCEHYNLLKLYPDLMAEWDFERNTISPENVTPGSNTQIWWRCKNNQSHQWRTTVYSRAKNDSGCRLCIPKSYSKSQIKWLNEIMNCEGINILHAENGGEFYIPNVGNVDGYCKENNTVYEYHGDFYHGHPDIFDPKEINTKVGKSFGELYAKTLKRDNRIKNLGYNLIVMWEHEFLAMKNS